MRSSWTLPKNTDSAARIEQDGGYLWQNRTRHIPLEELVHIVDGQSLTELNWLSSKTHAIEAEGLLVCRRLDRSWGSEVFYL